MPDVVVPPQPGLRAGLVVPEAELVERFSRSSGPGGQGVNTADSRVELRWDVANSTVLTEARRARLLAGLASRMVDGVVVLVASEHREQRRNRTAARVRLGTLIGQALAPPPPPRRATRPSRAARQRRLDEKKQRGRLKGTRARPDTD